MNEKRAFLIAMIVFNVLYCSIPFVSGTTLCMCIIPSAIAPECPEGESCPTYHCDCTRDELIRTGAYIIVLFTFDMLPVFLIEVLKKKPKRQQKTSFVSTELNRKFIELTEKYGIENVSEALSRWFREHQMRADFNSRAEESVDINSPRWSQ